MIKIKIKKLGNKIVYFSISGHANAGNYGEDIVCASVSSVVQMTLNGLLEIIKLSNFDYEIRDGFVRCNLMNYNFDDNTMVIGTDVLLNTMYTYLNAISEAYPKNVKLIIEEVLE